MSSRGAAPAELAGTDVRRGASAREPLPAVILANRAFLDHDVPRGSEQRTQPGDGGLLAALRPVIVPWDGETGTLWIGAGRGRFDGEWVDADGYELIPTPAGALRHRRLLFDELTWRGHYASVANSFFWPLLHLVRESLPERTGYYPRPQSPNADEWAAYEHVNRTFAEAATELTGERPCWIHDYQLALAPQLLREAGYRGHIGFFLHTPFPGLDVARAALDGGGLQALTRFVAGILGADLVGLQSETDVSRFAAAAVAMCGAEPVVGGVVVGGRMVRLASYPVGIDIESVLRAAGTQRPARLEGFATDGLPLVVGLERSDFTKGIPERLNAVAQSYREGARFAYLGIAAPTREGVPAYAGLEAIISAAADEAGSAARAAQLPFLHMREVIDWTEVVALQRAADVVYTSSLADGMNLVPLQAAIAQSQLPADERAVIITGRDAGVANVFAGFEKDGLVPVDPLDIGAMSHALSEAIAGRPGRVSERLV
ncbi:MAG: trehalose-6-phosphate synthase, partial [Tepidiformaceae bacterium]